MTTDNPYPSEPAHTTSSIRAAGAFILAGAVLLAILLVAPRISGALEALGLADPWLRSLWVLVPPALVVVGLVLLVWGAGPTRPTPLSTQKPPRAAVVVYSIATLLGAVQLVLVYSGLRIDTGTGWNSIVGGLLLTALARVLGVIAAIALLRVAVAVRASALPSPARTVLLWCAVATLISEAWGVVGVLVTFAAPVLVTTVASLANLVSVLALLATGIIYVVQGASRP